MERAKQRLVEAQRAAHLRAQADARQEAERLRRYCDAVEAVHGDNPPTSECLTWARDYIAGLDPLTEPPPMPEPPEATPEARQGHLPEGWSAHGPEQGARTVESRPACFLNLRSWTLA